MKYSCPRIMYTGEFLAPDFSAIDYFIGFDYCDFGDRCLRYPLHLWSDNGPLKTRKLFTEDAAYEELKKKTYFCNFIYGHQTKLNQRELLFEKLNEYKTVSSAGKFKNNMPNGKIYNMREKSEIIAASKFTITAESVHYPGFTSEKIEHAFRSYSIPVYWGDPLVQNEFNTAAFINCETLGGIEKAVEKVIEIDQNDEMYVHMLMQYQYVIKDYEDIM